MATEYCFVCGEPTGRAGEDDDSIYVGNEDATTGPWCDDCYALVRDSILAAANAPADPALLVLARLGAEVAHWVANDPSADVETEYLDLTGVMDNDRRWYQPGIADAIAALLPPADVDSVGPVTHEELEGDL